MSLTIKPATRQGVKPLIGLYSESGCGKTYSALLLARGFVGPAGKIVLADSESGRGSLYADVLPGGYNVLEITAPFSPAKHIEVIKAIEQSGAAIGILDSGSHEWENLGGVLDMAAEREAQSGKPGLHCWKIPKMEHAKFMLALLQSSIPWIICLRAKYKSRQQKNAHGKTEIVKDDHTTPIQAEDFIFEMTCHAEILHDHSIHLTKCSHPALRSCFPEKGPITIAHGEALAKWCANPGTGASDSAPVPHAKTGGSPNPAASPQKEATADQRQRMFSAFQNAEITEDTLKSFAEDKGWLAPFDELGDWPLNRVPTTMKQMAALIEEVNNWKSGVTP